MSTRTWKGENANWSTAADWTGGLPGASDDVVIDGGLVTVTKPIDVASVSLGGGFLTFDDSRASEVGGDFTIADSSLVFIDGQSASGGSTLNIDGNFSLSPGTGFVSGNTSLTEPDSVVVNGSYYLAGSLVLQSNAATLVTFDLFEQPAPDAATGQIYLSGDSLLEFDSGGIESIADNAIISLTGANARISNDTASPSPNSALTSLSDVAGKLALADGASVGPLSALTVEATGSVSLSTDAQSGAAGESLTISGALVDDGSISLDNAGVGAPVELDVEGDGGIASAASGVFNLVGASAAHSAELFVSDAAAGFGTAGVLTGSVLIAGYSLIEFADGGLTTIAAGSALQISGAHAFIADLGQTSSNSALTTLADNAGELILSAGATLDLATKFVSAGAIEVDAGSQFVSTGGSISIAGSLSGDGTLKVTAGSLTLANGAAPSIALVAVSGGARLAVAENMSDAGDINMAAGATLAIDAGCQATLMGQSTFSGAVNGAGALVLAAGSTTFGAHATLSTAKWSLAGTETSATVAGDLDFAGAFSEGAGATLNLTGGRLVLTGSAKFSGATVDGSQHLWVEGSTTVSDLTIGGAAIWANTMTAKQSGGDVVVGDASGGAAVLDNASTGTYEIVDNSDIARGAASASIDNSGLFEKTEGTGKSSIAVALDNAGSIAVSSGTLDFQRAVSGTGEATIEGGAKLEFAGSVASGQTVDFSGGGGELILAAILSGTTEQFHAKIGGFKAGETFDVGAPFGSGTSLHFTENGGHTEGTLTIAHGSSRASLTLLGVFNSSGFHSAPDSHGGIDISYSG